MEATFEERVNWVVDDVKRWEGGETWRQGRRAKYRNGTPDSPAFRFPLTPGLGLQPTLPYLLTLLAPPQFTTSSVVTVLSTHCSRDPSSHPVLQTHRALTPLSLSELN
ncbi:hypothetical protein CGLO_12261 [Colletotrichum gloeosporioides Cg-14]|uniref:Uncharacterized protein n=1 Tax=Colletotrichum gloeosporioides (strain Cg-14) TaxID=1237896 RepID=T0JZ97_COLGC|nr:hypothetical protein CGLO_12261 [Colletotrichum gloeosporioides Cg-14]